jgi:hypothetical protein
MVRSYGTEEIDTTLTRKPASRDYELPVPETDTGRMAEKAKVRELILYKELGKIPP